MNLGQVYTKRIIADYMVGMFAVADGARVLDPCFGGGVFVESLLVNTNHKVLGVEIDTDSFDKFTNPDSARCQVLNCDFFDIEEEFDGIIMNPPYVRQEGIDAMAELGVTKQKLQSACGLMTISTKANLYMYFILRAILLLKDGGELIAIVPKYRRSINNEFEYQLRSHGSLTDVWDVEGTLFDEPMVDVRIIKFVRGECCRQRTRYHKMSVGDNKITEKYVSESELLLTTKDCFTTVAEELCDDLPNELPFVIKRLEEISNGEHLSLEELDTLCWEDSSSMFNKIYSHV